MTSDADASGDVLRTLTLLGCFAFAYNAAVALHELGHVSAALIGGGRVQSLSLHPLGTSAVAIAPDPKPWLTAAGGPVLGSLLAFLIGAWAKRSDFPAGVPLVVLGAIGPLASGLGLLVGAIFGFGDAVELEREGIPRGAAAAVGTLLAALGASQVPAALGAVGLDQSFSFARRLVLLALGVGPYLAAIAAWNLCADPSQARPWILLVLAGASFLAVASHRSMAARMARAPTQTSATTAVIAGAVAIAVSALV